jgi:hypothetical protein
MVAAASKHCTLRRSVKVGACKPFDFLSTAKATQTGGHSSVRIERHRRAIGRDASAHRGEMNHPALRRILLQRSNSMSDVAKRNHEPIRS